MDRLTTTTSSTSPENSVFRVVFYPDRIYHAAYLNATRSPRYRYNVREVRSKLDRGVLKGEVYLDGEFLSNFLSASNTAPADWSKQRAGKDRLPARRTARLGATLPDDGSSSGGSDSSSLAYCPWVDAYQVEVWETLEPPSGKTHDTRCWT